MKRTRALFIPRASSPELAAKPECQAPAQPPRPGTQAPQKPLRPPPPSPNIQTQLRPLNHPIIAAWSPARPHLVPSREEHDDTDPVGGLVGEAGWGLEREAGRRQCSGRRGGVLERVSSSDSTGKGQISCFVRMISLGVLRFRRRFVSVLHFRLENDLDAAYFQMRDHLFNRPFYSTLNSYVAFRMASHRTFFSFFP